MERQACYRAVKAPRSSDSRATKAERAGANLYCRPGVRRDDPLIDIAKKWPGFPPAIFSERLPYRGGAMPGGGGGSDAVPPLSSGVMRRTVRRRVIRLGPDVCSFGYCEP